MITAAIITSVVVTVAATDSAPEKPALGSSAALLFPIDLTDIPLLLASRAQQDRGWVVVHLLVAS